MKTASRLYLTLLLFLFTISNCIAQNSKKSDDYLQKVLDNLENIESATYIEEVEGWQPGDTSALSKTCRYIKEINNPNDPTIGASFLSLDCNDRTFLNFGYDGDIRAIVYHKKKEITIDNFTAHPLPFRPIKAPFFNYTKNIIRYCLTTKDNIKYSIKDTTDIYYLKLSIDMDKQVEFFGGPYYINNTQALEDYISVYEIWINKSDNLPYKVRREMSHDISISSCSQVETNTLDRDNFDLYSYFPKDYNIVQYLQAQPTKKSKLIGKTAPEWTLKDMNGQSISLANIKSKIILLNFTGIGCGPCKLSIPLLNKIKKQYNSNEVEIISVESWQRKTNSLKNYANRNNINYTFLQANDNILAEYEVGMAAPVFFILNNQRIIVKVINGYQKDTTDTMIQETIDNLNKDIQ